jgi:hypothetical protein
MATKKILLIALLTIFIIVTWPFLFFYFVDAINIYIAPLPNSALVDICFWSTAIGTPSVLVLLILPKALPHTLNPWIRWLLGLLISALIAGLIFILMFYFMFYFVLWFHFGICGDL